ncbi:hypothetical protein [Marinomonas pontica]
MPECGGGWAVGDGEVADVAADALADAVVPVGGEFVVGTVVF